MLTVQIYNGEVGGNVKKIWLMAPLALALYACGAEDVEQSELKEEVTQTEELSAAEQSEWIVDERLQEPTEDTTCFMCNMKVYTKDHEQGVFSAQAVRKNGEVVFYDDIGCLLNDEYVNKVENEKFVRDYHTLNWFNVEEAFAVKTDIKSPMNWGYIFFKFEEDAKAYIAENEGAALATIDEIRTQAIERHQEKMMKNGEGHQHNHSNEDQMSNGHGDMNSSEEANE